MLAKMPQQNLKTETSAVKHKLVMLLVILIAGLGFAAGYTMIPLLQTTEPVYLNSNLTNNTASHTTTGIHIKNPTNSTKVVQKVTVQNSTNPRTTNTISTPKSSSINNKKSNGQNNS